MKQYKIRNRSQKNSHSCVPLNTQTTARYTGSVSATFASFAVPPATTKFRTPLLYSRQSTVPQALTHPWNPQNQVCKFDVDTKGRRYVIYLDLNVQSQECQLVGLPLGHQNYVFSKKVKLWVTYLARLVFEYTRHSSKEFVGKLE